MGRASRIFGIVSLVIAAAAITAGPAPAQTFSPGYKFLDSVKKKDANEVLAALAVPGSTIVNSRDITTGQSALHIVVERRDVLWIQFLTQKGANPNIRDAKGVTPLVLAANIGFIEGVEALITAGAQVDIPNSAGETPLITAVHKRDVPMMRVLLKAGANPDRPDNSGRSARDYAALDGPNNAMMLEIERSAKPASERGGTYGPSF